MRATLNGTVIAESAITREKHDYAYFPRDAVRIDLLRIAPKSESDLECPHGVQFYDVVDNGVVYERGAWSYEKPKASMQDIDHWVAFWGDIEVA